jgi:hypothetical protein
MLVSLKAAKGEIPAAFGFSEAQIFRMRAFFYIDGFNLYQARLKRSRSFRWLNIVALAQRLTGAGEEVERVNFYTAYVSGRIDPEAVRKQHAYLAALKTLPEVHIEPGNFIISDRWVKLVHPAEARPDGYAWPEPYPHFVKASIPQEKGSDVKLGVHLVRDSFLNAYDVAYVLTNDTDLTEPIRIASQELGKTVIIVPPILPRSPKNPVPSPSLKQVASDVRFIQNEDLEAAQFPDEVAKPRGGTLTRPDSWNDEWEPPMLL